MSNNPNQPVGQTRGDTLRASFTLIELLVVVAIIAVLAALLLPALRGARDRSKVAVCSSNMRQINAALALYLDDCDQYYPPAAYIVWPAYYWQEYLTAYVLPNAIGKWRIPDPNGWVWPSGGQWQNLQSIRNQSIFNCPVYQALKHAPGNPGNYNTGTPQYSLNALLNGDWVYRSPGTPVGGTGAVYRASDLLHPIVTVTETVMNDTGVAPEYGADSASDGRFPRYHEYMRHCCGFDIPKTLKSAWWDANRFHLPPMPGGANYLFNDGHVEYMPATTNWALNADSDTVAQRNFCPWLP